ncbi:NUDIX domain-containing protein [Ornithinimicrobium pratense]|uniref:NUDIX domain-containing protein n=1 Tax=Ornithinimicrobium pratense TaxID=2593973 RepID=A0A5J6V5Z9_9MICO|nr:NUDIX domain-containing protein [Ornithinimicrobium pratense]QFG69420.1 NUDIX domain-containing protein [Ornithinimicrobium pratense]
MTAAQPSDYVPPAHIRVLAVALVRHPRTGAHLMSEFVDQSRGAVFHRPPGGGIEFGETAQGALRREMLEEFATEVEVGERLAVIENLFTFNGAPGHEWVVVHAARLCDDRLLGEGPFPVLDAPTDVGVWRPPGGAGLPTLVPPGVAALLDPGTASLSRGW